MMQSVILFLLFLAQAATLPPATAVVPARVAELRGYSEGIVFDAAGFAYVSLLHQGEVQRLRVGSPAEKWAAIEEPNGHKVLPDGVHLIAAKGGIYRFSSEGRLLGTLASQYGPDKLRNPNDLALDGDGGVYFTDPGPDDDPAARAGKVYYAHAGKPLQLVATDFCFPNGLLVRDDGRLLYVDDSCTNLVYAFDIVGAGRLERRRIFAELPDSGRGQLDGMTADANGHLFVAHYGVGLVEVLDSTGHLLRRYPAGNQLSSNVAFGGPHLDKLYITGAPGAESGPGVLMELSLVGVSGRSSRARPARSR